ncbi:hypothetical protein LADH09A_005310 [Micromonospora sp. LAH09]|uniref:hypothetical protein n=1 Tax=Micromonospora cabrerizensis TaxID=2911213 RepID=UPI001EE87EF3|nr:hypothetical protein [Micromonospora cabrerizensis]MCG5471321.1 hypothetical protein [Micromonospora cabrerizensis]
MNPFRRADHAETERLLDSAHGTFDVVSGQADAPSTSAQVQGSAPAEPVARLLAAAAGPGLPGELAGEDAAVAAFRAARADPSPSVPHRPHGRRLTTGAVAWIGAVAVTATAGAAFAAVSQDWVPGPLAPEPTRTSPATGPASPRSGEPSRSPSSPGSPSPGTPSHHPPSPGTPPAPGTPPTHTAPGGSLHGLCRAWLAKKPDQREKALRTPAFERLVTAAGSAGQVEEYCLRLVPEAKPSAPSKVTPSRPPTGRPSPQ